MNKNLIIIFARNPELGKCKTRLAEVIGDVNALAVYKILLLSTFEVTKNLKQDKAVYYADKIEHNDIWDGVLYQKFKQEGEDLGIRMMHAFENSFENGYKKVVIVGTDIFDLNEHHFNEAFKALNTNDVVLGPAEDGGYYLLGMKTLHRSVFHHKEWGSSTVKNDTLADLSDQKVALLETLNDIDVYEDLKGKDIFKSFLDIENRNE